MTDKINLNADIGEGFGAYDIGNDAALMEIIKSASIACGFHAGDPLTMRRLIGHAARVGASVGAHPGFNDLWGFGRRRITMPAEDLEYLIAYQIGALQAMATYENLTVSHLKPHGALNNMAAEDEELALAIGRAIQVTDPEIIYVALAGSAMHSAAEKLGLRLAREAGEAGGTAVSGVVEPAVLTEVVAAVNLAGGVVAGGELEDLAQRHASIILLEVLQQHALPFK